MIENIKNLYEKITDKSGFQELVAKEFNVEKSTVRVGWFYRFEVPTKYKVRENLIKFMQNYIRENEK